MILNLFYNNIDVYFVLDIIFLFEIEMVDEFIFGFC